MKNVVKKLKQTLKYSGTLLGFLILLSTVAYGQQAPAQQYSCSASFLRSERLRIERDIERQLLPQLQRHFSTAQQILNAHLQGTHITGQYLTQFCPRGGTSMPMTVFKTMRPITRLLEGVECYNNVGDPLQQILFAADLHASACISLERNSSYQINGRSVTVYGLRACVRYDENIGDVVMQTSNIIHSGTRIDESHTFISDTLYHLYPRCRRRSDEGGSTNGADGLRGAQHAPQRAARTVSAFTSASGSDGAL